MTAATSAFDSTQLIALQRVGKIAVAPSGDWVAAAEPRNIVAWNAALLEFMQRHLG